MNNVNAFDIEFKDNIEIYKKAKKNLRMYNFQWKKYAGEHSVGNCAYLFDKLKPLNYKDFFYKYIKDGEESDEADETKRGRTREEIFEISKNYLKSIDNSCIPLEMCIDEYIMHVIIETFDGHMRELIIQKSLEEKGFKLVHGDKDEDSKLNIDFKVYKNNVLKYFIQVKPHTCFYSNKNESLICDRKRFFLKQREGNVIFPNVPYYYMIYDTNDGKWYKNKNNGRFVYLLDEICNKDGTMKCSGNKMFVEKFSSPIKN